MNPLGEIRGRSFAKPVGRVKLSLGGVLTTKGKFFLYDCRCNVMELESAYLVIDAQLDRFLVLRTPLGSCCVSLEYDGFQRVYDRLSKRFGFRDDLFQKYRQEKRPVKLRLWRKMAPANYSILEGSFSDTSKGFEIQFPHKEFISWDLPLAELKKKKNIKIKWNSFGSRWLMFKQPVRIGNLTLKNLKVLLYKPRLDAPVLHFQAKCYDRANTDQSYWELKQNLKKMREVETIGGYERADQNHFSISIGGMRIELTYTYDSTYGFDSRGTTIEIFNDRDYEDLRIDQKYESVMEVSAFTPLQKEIVLIGDYKKDKSVQRLPPLLTASCGEQPVIWMDRSNGKIGFADNKQALLYDFHALERIAIQNTLPAKGAGYSELKVGIKGTAHYQTVFRGGCYCFDDYAPAFKQLSNKPVKFLPETMDV